MNTFAAVQMGSLSAARLGLTLLHMLWEGVIIGAMVAAALLCLRRTSPILRYWVSCFGMALLPLAALVTFTILPAEEASQASPGSIYVRGEPSPATVSQGGSAFVAASESEDVQLIHGQQSSSFAAAADPVTSRTWLNLRRFLPALGAAWVLGVLVLSVYRMVGWAYLRRVFRSGGEPASPWPDILQSLCAKLKITRPVRILQTSWVCVPAVVGWLRPVILLPVSALTNMPVDQLQALIGHELAHIRRHDYPINLMLTAIETLFFYHPSTWWISRQIRREREDCCDDVAAEAAGSRVLYARALAELEELRLPAGFAMAASDGGLLRRVRRLVGKTDSTPPPMGATLPLLLVVTAAVGWLASTSARPEPATEVRANISSDRRPAPLLTGTVLDIEGKPAAGASVFVTRYVERDPEILASATTGGDGAFSMASTLAATRPETDYNYTRVFAIIPGIGTSSPQHFEAGRSVQFRLLPSAELHVQFLGPDDKPISGMLVWPAAITIRDDSEPVAGRLGLPPEVAMRLAVRTNQQGMAIFRGLPRESRIVFDDDDDRYAQMDYNEVVPLERQGVIEAAPIHLMAAATITGSLVYADTKKPGTGLGVYAQSVSNSGSGIGMTDASGHFSISRLKPSRYIVAMQPDDDRFGDWTARAAEIDVAQGEHATANLPLIHGGIITGIVRDQESHKGLAGLDVALHGPAHPSAAAGVQWARTNADGVYRMRVPPGTQTIYLMSAPPDGYLRPSANPFHTEDIVVGDGQTVTYNFDLPVDKSPAINGIVLDPDGKPVHGATVLYTSNEPAPGDLAVHSGSDGRFRIREIARDGELRGRFGPLATKTPVPYPTDNHDVIVRLSTRATYSLMVR